MNQQSRPLVEGGAAEPETVVYMRYQAGDLSDQEMLRALQPMITRLSGAVASHMKSKFPNSSFQEIKQECLQDMSIALITNVKRIFNVDHGKLSTYLYSAFRNNALHYLSPVGTTSFEPDQERSDDDERDFYPTSYTPDYADEADRERALKKMSEAVARRKMQAKSKQPDEDHAMKPEPMTQPGPLLIDLENTFVVTKTNIEEVMKATEARTELADSHMELKSAIEYLMLEHREAAFLLGLKKPTLSSYLYGKTSSVPEIVLEGVRELMKNQQLLDERNAFLNHTMEETINKWCEDVGIEKGNIQRLAEYLEIHVITIERWLSGMRPSMSGFRKHYRRVYDLPEIC